MIEGLRLKVTHEELRAHCVARGNYHADRAEQKVQELPGLKAAMDRVQTAAKAAASGVASMPKGSYNVDNHNPVEALETDIRDHRNRALVFQYFADHLFPEDYDLGENDLIRLEIVKRI